MAYRTLSFPAVNTLMFTQWIAVLKYLATDGALQTFTDLETPLWTPHPLLLGIYKQTERGWLDITYQTVHISFETKLDTDTELYVDHHTPAMCCPHLWLCFIHTIQIGCLKEGRPWHSELVFHRNAVHCFIQAVLITSHEYSDQSVHVYKVLICPIAAAYIAFISGQDIHVPYVSAQNPINSITVIYKADQPCFVFIWAFMFRVRLKTTWQTGHLVLPLWTSLCLYREPWFRNFFPQILHWCPSMRGTMFSPAMPFQSPGSPTHRLSTNRKRSKSIAAPVLYSNPCFATMWRFMWSMRLRRTLQIGQRVFPLWTLLCL